MATGVLLLAREDPAEGSARLPQACIALSADEVSTPRAQCANSPLSHFSGSPCPSPGLHQSDGSCPSKSNSFSNNEAQRLAMLVSPRASLVGLKPAPAGPLFELAEQLAATFAKERAILQISMPGAMVDAQCPADCFSRLDARIRQLVHSYATCGGSDWRDMVAFNPHHYVRHLVDGNEEFELMLICWSPGQASRVHNHASSHCWLTVLEGQVEEEVFGEAPDAGCWPSRPDSPRPAMPGVLTLQDKCPELLPKHRCLLETPATGYINDSLGLHRVSCPEQTPAPGAVTLHLYAPPIRRVKLYEPEEGRVITRVPGFHSVRGRRCAIS